MANLLEATSFGSTSTTDDVLSGVNLKGKRKNWLESRFSFPHKLLRDTAPRGMKMMEQDLAGGSTLPRNSRT
jgi:hypothetical protein